MIYVVDHTVIPRIFFPVSGVVLSAFGRFNQWGGGGGGVCAVRFWADSTSGGVSLSANSINQVSALSADSTSGRWRLSYRGVRMYVNKGGGGGGGRGRP